MMEKLDQIFLEAWEKARGVEWKAQFLGRISPAAASWADVPLLLLSTETPPPQYQGWFEHLYGCCGVGADWLYIRDVETIPPLDGVEKPYKFGVVVRAFIHEDGDIKHEVELVRAEVLKLC